MKMSAIVPAGGSGERMGGAVRKQFIELMGRPILLHTLLRLASSPLIGEIIVAVPKESLDMAWDMLAREEVGKPVKVVAGGAVRQESVSLAFGHVDPGAELALVHDGVRPFVTAELVEKVALLARKTGAAVAACRARDTLKRAKGSHLGDVVPRDDLVHIQTPQCFHYSILGAALERAEKDGASATDESSLVQRLGMDVSWVEAPLWNIKITTAEDLALAEALARNMIF